MHTAHEYVYTCMYKTKKLLFLLLFDLLTQQVGYLRLLCFDALKLPFQDLYGALQ